jgi:acetoin utilization deacetylase AcuC-like enzyme
MLPIAFHPIYKHPLPDGHRFPMVKYELLPQQLIHEGTAIDSDFFEPQIIDLEKVLAVHEASYVEDLLTLSLDPKKARKIGFPLSDNLVQRELMIADGTLKGTHMALKHGISFNIAGGTHHAYAGHGEAFCLLNDQAIAAKHLLDTNQAHKILIIDLDVHQGNGTASIFDGNPSVFTFSMHGKSNYPFKKETSDLDIALDDHCSDEEFLKIVNQNVPKLLDQVKPDFVFYLSGVDILGTDKLGKLSCSLEGCKKRDTIVFEHIHKRQIPVQVSMGGGYSPEIKTIIEAHANTYRVAKSIFY